MSIRQEILLSFCRLSTRSIVVLIRAVSVGLISLALLLPANAQYWNYSWGGRQQQRQQVYNPFGGGFWGGPGYWGDRQAPHRFRPHQLRRTPRYRLAASGTRDYRCRETEGHRDDDRKQRSSDDSRE